MTLNNFETICRTCLCSNNLQAIENDAVIIEILQIITDYQIDDKLPKNICEVCVLKVSEIRSFVMQCKSSDKTLKISLAETETLIKSETPTNELQNEVITKDQEQNEAERTSSSTSESNIQSENAFIYKCDLCSLDFMELGKFTRHIRVHRGGATPPTKTKIKKFEGYKCDGCELVFTSVKHLKQHKRVQHVSNAEHKCEICSKEFMTLSSLKRHRVLHVKDHSFMCNICGRKFNFVYNLKVHLRVHTGLKPYKCPECGRNFANSTQLKRHNQLHTNEKPYFCETCSKCFTEPGQLKQHRRTHSGEKPYFCQLCEKGFSFSNSLIRHNRTHTGDRPYKCKLCLKKFMDSSNLSRHIRTHNK